MDQNTHSISREKNIDMHSTIATSSASKAHPVLSLVSSHAKSLVFSKTMGWQSHGALRSNLSDVCGLLDIPAPNNQIAKDTLFQHVSFKAGKRIHTIGQHFDTLYIVNSGFLKTVVFADDGKEQILNFPMKGDVLGIDGICTLSHVSETIALSNCDLISVPYKTFSTLGRTFEGLDQSMLSVISRELVRDQVMISMLTGLGAEAKVARFLTNLAERFIQLGYSGKIFNLRMTRNEIANYLGLALETVSRTLSAFHEMGLITVDQREIAINNHLSLKALRKLPVDMSRNKLKKIT
jgi:CRP/FNR family transcriptional regulator